MVSPTSWINQEFCVQEIELIFSSNIWIAQGQVSIPAIVGSVSHQKTDC